eukprot:scaffold80203_cov73-Phaeocystis_antarctica.AAC.5
MFRDERESSRVAPMEIRPPGPTENQSVPVNLSRSRARWSLHASATTMDAARARNTSRARSPAFASCSAASAIPRCALKHSSGDCRSRNWSSSSLTLGGLCCSSSFSAPVAAPASASASAPRIRAQ